MMDLAPVLIFAFWIYSGWRVVLGRSGHLETRAGPFLKINLFSVPASFLLFDAILGQGEVRALMLSVPVTVGLWLVCWGLGLVAAIRREAAIKRLTPEYRGYAAAGKTPALILHYWSVELVPNMGEHRGYREHLRMWSDEDGLHTLRTLTPSAR